MMRSSPSFSRHLTPPSINLAFGTSYRWIDILQSITMSYTPFQGPEAGIAALDHRRWVCGVLSSIRPMRGCLHSGRVCPPGGWRGFRVRISHGFAVPASIQQQWFGLPTSIRREASENDFGLAHDAAHPAL